jgi:predicted RNA-binding Zn-ribbon protein involved in translation (DUF1610 family)
MKTLTKCEKCGGPLEIDDSLAGQEIQCPNCGDFILAPAPSRQRTNTANSSPKNPFTELARRGYRGKPELESIDRKLAEEYGREHAAQNTETRSWRPKQDQTTKIFVGIGSLMILFFVCLWITHALQVRRERQAIEELGRKAREGMQQVAEDLQKLIPKPRR